eukprot:TRINITY_DN94017_c0_g1_i1.p1 TRINITY_DN94017_c0_g1~~TRINITY_DN94017_c0_g1_i1.p1  ORF type:complete len:597 (+),score=108.80 TRINITY_DN94017_c0_g1_i1:62-1852(+)
MSPWRPARDDASTAQVECSSGDSHPWSKWKQRSASKEPRPSQRRAVSGRLAPMDWKGVVIQPPVKAFRSVHPNVDSMSNSDVEMLHLKYGINMLPVGESRPREIPKPVECFEEAFIPDWAAKVLRDRCYQKPTPIQIQAWSVASFGYDMLAIACTGSGKTMAYILPMLQHVSAQEEVKPEQGPIGLILVPSRELCQQVSQEIQSLLAEAAESDSAAPRIRVKSVFGGSGGDRNLLGHYDVMVACPGRLLDLLRSGDTNLHRASYIVVDEADDLLAEKNPDMEDIFSQIRPADYRQLLLFTATHQESIVQSAKAHCNSPFFQISVGGLELSACRDVEQYFWARGHRLTPAFWDEEETKKDALLKAIDMIPSPSPPEKDLILIFVNHQETVNDIVDALRTEAIEAWGIHSKTDQKSRDRLLADFTNGHIRILVSTNLLGRGIDVPDIKWVINYDMPERSLADYIHRVGRTGRAGRRGVALTLLDELDFRHSKAICDMLRASDAHQMPGIPDWLEKEARCFKKYWKLYNDKKRSERECNNVREEAQKVAKEDGVGGEFLVEWRGRGGAAASRIEEVLAQTAGLGIVMPGTGPALKQRAT